MSKVFVATPVYSGDLCHEYVGSFINTFVECIRQNIGFNYSFLPGLCYLDQARNKLVDQFLKTDCTDFLFIDSDLGWDASKIPELIKRDEDILCGVYPFKLDEEGYPVRVFIDKDEFPQTKGDLIRLAGAPTGMLRIKRHVLEKMIEKHQEWNVKTFNIDGSIKESYNNLFHCEQVGDLWWGEDYNFCRIAINDGFEVFAYPNIDFVHVGRKAWKGNYQNFLRRQPGGDLYNG